MTHALKPSPTLRNLPGRGTLFRAWIVVGVAVGVLIARGLAVQGLFAPVAIEGGSMSPALLGPRREVRCHDCTFAWACEPFDDNAAPRLVCPNCGAKQGEQVAARPMSADRVWIDRAAFVGIAPARGDLVAVRIPGERDKFAVKRVAALPGETWSIENGDLLIDGKRSPKAVGEFLETAVVVHDDRCRPQSLGGTSRWKPSKTDTVWHLIDNGFVWESPRTPDVDWLRYENWACVETAPERQGLVPVRDLDPFNASLARTLNEVRDLAVHFDVEIAAEAAIHVAIGQTNEDKVAASFAVRPKSTDVIPLPPGRTRHSVLFGSIDGRTIVTVDGRAVAPRSGPHANSLPVTSVRPVCLSGSGSGMLTISNVRVLRDVFLLDEHGRSGKNTVENELGRDEFALLGDNPPVSIDSRQWPQPIRRGDILGRVIPLRRRQAE